MGGLGSLKLSFLRKTPGINQENHYVPCNLGSLPSQREVKPGNNQSKEEINQKDNHQRGNHFHGSYIFLVTSKA